MKQPKKAWTSLLLAAALALSLTACRGHPAGSSIPGSDGESTKNTTTTTVKAEKLSEKEKKALTTSLDSAFAVPESDKADDPAFLTEVETKNGYEVLSAESRGDTVTATLRVYAPDLCAIAEQIDAQGSDKTEAELLEAIHTAVASAKLTEKTLVVEFEKTGNSYTPLITAELFDAYYGGIFRLYDRLLAAAETEG